MLLRVLRGLVKAKEQPDYEDDDDEVSQEEPQPIHEEKLPEPTSEAKEENVEEEPEKVSRILSANQPGPLSVEQDLPIRMDSGMAPPVWNGNNRE